MKEEYFMQIDIPDEKKTPEVLSEIEGIIGEKPYMEKDMYAVAMGSGFMSGKLKLSPTKILGSTEGADGVDYMRYMYKITDKVMDLEESEKSLDSIVDHMKEKLSPIEDKFLTVYSVTATDVPLSYSIIQKIPE